MYNKCAEIYILSVPGSQDIKFHVELSYVNPNGFVEGEAKELKTVELTPL